MPRHGVAMKMRVLVAVLWFFAVCYCWVVISHWFEVTEVVGPVLGAAFAAFFAGDPLHRIWAPRAPKAGRTDIEVAVAGA